MGKTYILEELDAKRPVPSLFWLLTGGVPSSHARRYVLRVQKRLLVHTDLGKSMLCVHRRAVLHTD